LEGHYPHPHYKLSEASLGSSQLYHFLQEQHVDDDDDDVVVVVVVAAAAAVAAAVVSSYSATCLSTEICLFVQYPKN
jgi:hypothetical protein